MEPHVVADLYVRQVVLGDRRAELRLVGLDLAAPKQLSRSNVPAPSSLQFRCRISTATRQFDKARSGTGARGLALKAHVLVAAHGQGDGAEPRGGGAGRDHPRAGGAMGAP